MADHQTLGYLHTPDTLKILAAQLRAEALRTETRALPVQGAAEIAVRRPDWPGCWNTKSISVNCTEH
ncbi:hypothetical protein J2Z31_002769 [Sinorhizobium kostiense]|uniref:Transposase n=1 Tax=Sinorhizobium kostiense TaxID=76747 RepID=A0ABS4R039_9HYPH|nr:hypothetical protein [Sinorhizobium kostiense]